MAEPAARVAIKTEIAVIGAGQAGLSSAYHLQRLGVAAGRGFVVLDQSPQAGGAWQYRWPSLTLSTVNRIHDLPGMAFSEALPDAGDSVEAAVAVPIYFAAYERKFALPVYRPVKVGERELGGDLEHAGATLLLCLGQTCRSNCQLFRPRIAPDGETRSL